MKNKCVRAMTIGLFSVLLLTLSNASTANVAIAIVTTKQPQAEVDTNYSQKLFVAIAQHVDPAHPLLAG